jgi:uncharacterized glyoxalase superfamily protein PhnB
VDSARPELEPALHGGDNRNRGFSSAFASLATCSRRRLQLTLCLKAAIKGAEVYLPERTTFYGAREIGIKDPAGHYIAFAQIVAPPKD